MTDASREKAGDFEHVRTRSGLDLFVLPTKKWKTRILRLHLRSPLSDRNAARALVPNLLRRGTRRMPTMAAVSRAFEGLYGAIWTSSAYKLGDEQVVAFRLETVEERFLPGRPRLLEPALRLAREVLHEPRLADGVFPAAVFEQEKLNHRREIEALYNDKMSFAFQRLLDLMFPGEPYGRPVLGTEEECDALTPAALVAAHRELLSCPMRAFAVGDFTAEEAARLVEELVPEGRSDRNGVVKPGASAAGARPASSRLVVEEDDVSQSKLVSGRRVDLAGLGEREFDALRVYAGVLGGGFHSRLFQTVREKHSLAYFASASLDRLRGVLYTSCGIDAAARDRVRALVEEEIASLKAAPPRAEELDQTKRLIVAGTRSLVDSPSSMVESLDASFATGRVRTLEQIARSVESITAEDVHAAARRIGPAEVEFCLQGEARPEGA